jgi:hypothetical protein
MQCPCAHFVYQEPGKANLSIASFENGHFSVKGGNVQLAFLPNAGITLDTVTAQHTGKYYVIAHLLNDDTFFMTLIEMGVTLMVYG